MRRLFAAFFILTAFVFQNASAAEKAGGLYNPQQFTLNNGMQVVVIPDHRAPVVVHMVWYRVGSADEVPGKSGLAHFLEHLMFKGTEKIPPGQFSKIVAANGGRDNAFTSYDYTAYFQVIARNKLDMVMEMEAERMTGLQLDDQDVLTERDVVLEERRQRTDSSPQALFGEQMRAAQYLSYPYGRPVIGWEDEVTALTLQDALAFYRQYYAPNNAILIVAGDITAEELKPLAEKFYGTIPNNPDLKPRLRSVEPKHLSARRLTAEDHRLSQPMWQRSYVTDGEVWGETQHAAAMALLSDILGGGTTSRLYQRLVVKDQLANSAGSWYSGFRLGPGSFGAYASVAKDKSPADVEKAIDEEIARVMKDGVTEDELKRARTSALAEAIYGRDSLSRGARVFGIALTSGLTVEQVEAWPDRLRKVTVDDVKKAAARVFRKEYSVTGVLSPKKKEG